jgi:hypothetical protein
LAAATRTAIEELLHFVNMTDQDNAPEKALSNKLRSWFARAVMNKESLWRH